LFCFGGFFWSFVLEFFLCIFRSGGVKGRIPKKNLRKKRKT
jgi:hypothetical protein